MKKVLILFVSLLISNSAYAQFGGGEFGDSSGDINSIGDCSTGACFTGIDGSLFTILGAAAPTTDAAGETAFDNNAWATGRGALQAGYHQKVVTRGKESFVIYER